MKAELQKAKLAHLRPEGSLDDGVQASHLLLSLVSSLAFGVGSCPGCPLQPPAPQRSAFDPQARSEGVRNHNL